MTRRPDPAAHAHLRPAHQRFHAGLVLHAHTGIQTRYVRRARSQFLSASWFNLALFLSCVNQETKHYLGSLKYEDRKELLQHVG